DLLQGRDLDVAAAGDDLLLSRPVTLHFGRWAFDAQVFRRQGVGSAVGELDLEPAFLLEEAQLGRPRRRLGFVAALVGHRLGELVAGVHGVSLSGRASLTSMMGMPSRTG